MTHPVTTQPTTQPTTPLPSNPANPAYQAIFRRYIVTGLRQTLDDLGGEGFTLAESQRQQIWHLLSYGLTLDGSWPQVRELLLALAPKMEQAGFREEWLSYLARGLDQARTLGDRRAEAEINLQVGFLYLRLRHLDTAQAHLTAAQDLFTALDDLAGRCAAMNRLAATFRYAGDLAQARSLITYTLSALPEGTAEWAYSHFAAGLLYRELLDLNVARQHFEQSLVVSIRLGNRRQTGLCILNLGLVHFERKAYAQAADRAVAARVIFEEIGDLHNLASVLMNAGNAYSQMNQVDQALALFAQAEAIFHRLHDSVSLAMIHCNQGIAYRQLQRFDDAIQAFQAGIVLWDQVGNLKRRINLVSGLGKAQMDLAQFDAALATLTTGLAELEAAGPDAAVDNEYLRLTDVLRRDIALAGRGERSLD